MGVADLMPPLGGQETGTRHQTNGVKSPSKNWQRNQDEAWPLRSTPCVTLNQVNTVTEYSVRLAVVHHIGTRSHSICFFFVLAGEEVFIDYGIEWEKAWEEHVNSWTPPRPPTGHWITAKEANDNKEEILSEFISGDLREVVDHPYLFTACQYYASEADEHEVYKEPYDEWRDESDEKILAWYADSSEGYGYYYDAGYDIHGDFSHWPCSVLYEEQVGTYTVRIHQSPYEHTMPWEENDVPRILTSYSRANIHYFVKPFAADQFLPGAFRKELGIPNEMFPEHWKNLKRR